MSLSDNIPNSFVGKTLSCRRTRTKSCSKFYLYDRRLSDLRQEKKNYFWRVDLFWRPTVFVQELKNANQSTMPKTTG